MLSAWFAGEVTLLPFPYLGVVVLLAYGVSGVWSFTFSGVGVDWSQVCGPSCDSWFWTSDARLHRPDALASGRTLSFCRRGSLPWAFIWPWVSRPCPCLGSSLLLVVLTFPCPGFSLGASGRWMVQAPALSWALPWILPSRFQCWLLA